MFKFLYKKPKPSKSKYEFKMLYDFETRKKESDIILLNNPDKIPVIIEKSDSSNIQDLNTHIWIINKNITISQLMQSVRAHLKLDTSQCIFFFINNSYIASTKETLDQVYKNHSHETKDGWLYITYSG